MKTTIKGLIKRHLIKVCKSKTAIMRERIEPKPKKQFSKKKIDEAFSILRKQWGVEVLNDLLSALGVLFDAPELNRNVFQLEVLGVIVLDKKYTTHPYGVGVPCIVTRSQQAGNMLRLFYTDGNGDNGYGFTIEDEPRPATDAEIEQCIENLTEKQWSAIMNPGSPLFVPVVAEAMASEVEVMFDDGTSDAKSEEIETNGRRISIAGKEEQHERAK